MQRCERGMIPIHIMYDWDFGHGHGHEAEPALSVLFWAPWPGVNGRISHSMGKAWKLRSLGGYYAATRQLTRHTSTTRHLDHARCPNVDCCLPPIHRVIYA